MAIIVRSRRAPSVVSAHRTTSHITIAMVSIETVYTFSFTVDWFQTVQAVAEISTPAAAVTRRGTRSVTMVWSQRSSTRNQSPAEQALVAAAKRLIRTA